MSSDAEERKRTESGLYESLLAEEASSCDAIDLSDDPPSRVSFETTVDELRHVSVAYGHISLLDYETNPPRVRVRIGEESITITGHNLGPVYRALHTQKANRIVEQGTEDFGPEGPDCVLVEQILFSPGLS